ncbi:hypothetical protein OM076_20040 [Solirubrobacter ginsenosidimutans]|uniref:Uncharacterized protein n=1 Tax=Solirubrobacter ginsenosidimutans TaxID=490573 RepID=A0A9X3MT68_9ACTN|nr:hypothetical protein [Solirubrobacter ginsenosidimutans]MDA0162576.1 hypothetical protein [Solirubrobacter ginsenosidimutans]
MEAHHEGPEPTPTLPASAAIARTMAAGALLSAASLAIAATLVFLVAAVRLAFAQGARLTFDGAAPVLLAVAFALGCAATLASPAWPWPARRPRTLALAAIVAAASPVSGHVLPALALAIVAVGLALVRDHRTPGGRRVTHWGVAAGLSVAALAAAIAGAALAESHPLHPTASLNAGAGHAASTRSESTAGQPAPAKPATQRPAKSRHGEAPPAKHGSTHGKPAPRGNGTTAPPATDKAAPPSDGKSAPPTESETAPPTDDKAVPPADGKTAPPTHGVTTPPADGNAPPATGDETPGSSEPAPAAPAERGSALPGAAPDADAATAFVRDYYAALDERRFEDAWAVLSPAIQQRFGGFARWQAGYAQTAKSDPRELITRPDGGALIVNVRLVAHEKNCDASQTFRVTWRLEPTADGWHVAGLQGIALGGRPCE